MGVDSTIKIPTSGKDGLIRFEDFSRALTKVQRGEFLFLPPDQGYREMYNGKMIQGRVKLKDLGMHARAIHGRQATLTFNAKRNIRKKHCLQRTFKSKLLGGGIEPQSCLSKQHLLSPCEDQSNYSWEYKPLGLIGESYSPPLVTCGPE